MKLCQWLLLLFSRVQLFAAPWIAACQAYLSFTFFWSLFRLVPTELVMLSNRLILCLPLLLWSQSSPTAGSFPVSQVFASHGQSIGATASVLQWNIQGRLPLGLTGLMSLVSKGLSRVFSSNTVRKHKHQFFGTQPSLWSNSHICAWLLEKP